MIKRLAACIREYKRPTILTPVCMVGEVVCECTIPLLTADLINAIQNGCTMQTILSFGLKLFVIAMLSLGFGSLSGWFAAEAAAGFAKNLRHDLYYQVQGFSFANIDRFSTSSLVTRLTTDVTNIQNAFMMCIRIAVRAPMMLVFAVVMSVRVGKQLALIFAGIVPVLGFALFLMIRSALPLFKAVFKKYDALNNSVQENVQAMRVVKSFVREDYETEKFSAASDSVRKDFLKAEKILALNSPVMQFCVYTSMILISYFAAKLIVTSGGTYLGVGSLTSMITYSMQILMSLMMLSMIFVMLTMAQASGKRICEVLDETRSLQNPAEPVYDVKNGDVDFDHVNFKYSAAAKRSALSDVDFHVRSGQTVGIIGGTGSSKTSLVQLICRLYDVTDGSVKVGSAAWTCGSTIWRRCATRSRSCCRRTCCSPARSRRICAGATRTRRTRSCSGPASWRVRMNLSSRCRTNTTPISSRAARTSPAGRSSVSASRGRCSRSRRYSSLTTPPAPSIPAPTR